MPYITKERRYDIDTGFDAPRTTGELNYRLTSIINQYLGDKGKSYQTINDISGAMTECLAEFRRRVIVNYEIEKCLTNGDCY